MPTYDYRCGTCGKVFEVAASMSEKAKGLHVLCPACASADVTQVFRQLNYLRPAAGRSSSGDSAPSAGCGPGCPTCGIG